MPDIRSFHFKKWQDEFEKHLPEGQRVAFEKAEEKFNNDVGMNYFSSFESFKSSRSSREKRKKRRQ